MWVLIPLSRWTVLTFRRTMLQAVEPIIPFSSLILIEPLLSPEGSHHLRRLREILVKGAYERRDVWADREQAMAALKRRERTKKWDPRILNLFVVSPSTASLQVLTLVPVIGVRHCPAPYVTSHSSQRVLTRRHLAGALYPEGAYPGVTIACSRDQEAVSVVSLSPRAC
jgi:hypothetical protein